MVESLKAQIPMKKTKEPTTETEVEIIFGDEPIDCMTVEELAVISMHLFDELILFYNKHPDKYQEFLKK